MMNVHDEIDLEKKEIFKTLTQSKCHHCKSEYDSKSTQNRCHNLHEESKTINNTQQRR